MKYVLLLTSSLVLATPALAEEAATEIADSGRIRDTEIVVVATGSLMRLDQTGQPISVVGADELRAVQGPDLTRVLERLPGVTITRNGGLGGFTGLRVRGAEAEQTLVLVDGVRQVDVANPGAGYDLGSLMTGGIGKVELLRGSNSVIWGSQAIGGVLNLTSREIDGAEASLEYGSRDSLDAQMTAGVSKDSWGLTLNAGHTRTDGISQALVGTEPDGFRQWRVGAKGRVALAPGLTLNATARYADSRFDYDGSSFSPPYQPIDTPEYQTTREGTGRVGLAYQGDGFQLGAGYALTDIRRAYFDPRFSTDPNYETHGRIDRADLTGRIDLPAGFALDFGADSEWSRFSSTFDSEKNARLASGHALLGYYGDRLTLAAGARIDDHSRFGSAWTFGANGSFRIAGDWRVRASYGEGFKAPTLFQLFSDYGNAALVPERSRSYDVGIEKGDRNGPLHFAATLFRRDSRNLIDFVSCFGVVTGVCASRPFGTYDNVGQARAEGFELEADVRPTERLSLHAAYSYVKAVNRTPGSFNEGNDLARRPRNALTLAADWRTPLNDLVLGGDIRMVGDSFDEASNATRLDGYVLVGLRASVPVTEKIEVFGRIENLTDEQYVTARGYGTAGRSAYAGVRARF